LNEKKAEYLIVGGFAYSFHAEPRFTKDIDIFINRSAANAGKVLEALADFWNQPLSIGTEDLTKPGLMLQFGIAPIRIDILTAIDGLDFPSAWKNRINADYGDIPAWFVSLDDLIVNKEASGRDQDLLDAKVLKKVRIRKGG